MNVSAHACIRYLERVCGVDIDALREAFRVEFPEVREIGDGLLASFIESEVPGLMRAVAAHIEAACGPALAAGATRVRRGGVVYVLRGGACVTITPAGPQHHSRFRRGKSYRRLGREVRI